jgi:hypothetical protein
MREEEWVIRCELLFMKAILAFVTFSLL